LTGILTGDFMAKVSEPGFDPDAFYKATNIPCFSVGATDLRGSIPNIGYGGIDLGSPSDASRGILNATFFAPSSGAKPQIWASGGTGVGVGVIGSYTGSPDPSMIESVPLVGYQPGTGTVNGISASFNLEKWSGTTWGATITNGAAPANSLTGATGFTAVNPITFQGGAAGTAEDGNLMGTAAGIVK